MQPDCTFCAAFIAEHTDCPSVSEGRKCVLAVGHSGAHVECVHYEDGRQLVFWGESKPVSIAVHMR